MKLTEYQKYIVGKCIIEKTMANTESYQTDLAYDLFWLYTKEEFTEDTIIFISRKSGTEIGYQYKGVIVYIMEHPEAGDKFYRIDLAKVPTKNSDLSVLQSYDFVEFDPQNYE